MTITKQVYSFRVGTNLFRDLTFLDHPNWCVWFSSMATMENGLHFYRTYIYQFTHTSHTDHHTDAKN